jgi:hypothetical protein
VYVRYAPDATAMAQNKKYFTETGHLQPGVYPAKTPPPSLYPRMETRAHDAQRYISKSAAQSLAG